MKKEQGEIIITPGTNVWPHELDTAHALAAAGYPVKFVRRSEEQRAKSADVLIDGQLWEMKSPVSDKPAAVDKNVRKALHQSKYVIFDSRRMKRVTDIVVEKELRKSAVLLRSMKRLLFVNRKGEVVDIK